MTAAQCGQEQKTGARHQAEMQTQALWYGMWVCHVASSLLDQGPRAFVANQSQIDDKSIECGINYGGKYFSE